MPALFTDIFAAAGFKFNGRDVASFFHTLSGSRNAN